MGSKLVEWYIYGYKYLLFVVGTLFLILLFDSCSKSEENSAAVEATTPNQESSANQNVMKYDPSKATATIYGKINFQGNKPQPQELKAGKEECKPFKPIFSEEVIVNDNGTLKNVIVYVKDGAEKFSFDTPTQPKTLDQKGCKYTPHVDTIQVGQPLEIINSDAFAHNVHAMGSINPELNLGQPTQGMKSTKKFEHEEVTVPFKCDVHPWMSAYFGVFKHPFHTVTKEDGTYELKLPPGTYTIETWHEKFGTKSEKITVEDNQKKELDFTYNAE